ncbi:hypothetical protein MMC28_002100 [Mycoblastus sanguinarius]|nr:hypothetical protein [Mycoblastus sanguinarius]
MLNWPLILSVAHAVALPAPQDYLESGIEAHRHNINELRDLLIPNLTSVSETTDTPTNSPSSSSAQLNTTLSQNDTSSINGIIQCYTLATKVDLETCQPTIDRLLNEPWAYRELPWRSEHVMPFWFSHSPCAIQLESQSRVTDEISLSLKEIVGYAEDVLRTCTLEGSGGSNRFLREWSVRVLGVRDAGRVLLNGTSGEE